MARSAYIYTVGNRGKPAACFTVKHEMISWLRRAPLTPEELGWVEVWRYQDGERKEQGPVLMGTGAEILEGEQR